MTASPSPATTPASAGTAGSLARWRTVDIVVVAVIAVAFGVVFWAWNYVWAALDPLFTAFRPAQYLISGVWLMPAVVAPLIVRRPGAAVFGEVVAASVSALLGSVWGLDVLLSGLAQGLGAEIVFAVVLYRAWSLPVAALAGAGAAVGMAAHDIPVYYPPSAGYDTGFYVPVLVAMLASGIVVAGVGGHALVRALGRTGVLRAFPSGA
jgi:energy-coupling factor transport system substrate-specific component